MTTSTEFVDLESLATHGSGLVRPECVLTGPSGDLFVSHFEGGISRLCADGGRLDVLGAGEATISTNGFAITAEGDYLCAALLSPGGVWRLRRDGTQEPFLLEIDGRSLPGCNFVSVDRLNRVWITFSTWLEPRDKAYRPGIADGAIILVDGKGARIAAEGLGYTNEAILDPTGSWLYVNETFARRTTRFAVGADGSLSGRATLAEYGAGTFPDGLALDEEGGLWIVSIVSNRVIRLAPDGRQTILLEDSDPEWLEVVERAFQAGELGRPHLDKIRSKRLGNISSIAFGGSDRRTAYLGNLLDDKIHSFRSPFAGVRPVHWDFLG